MTSATTKPAMLRAKDAAAYLGLGERMVRDLAEAGILHRRYIGPRQYRITVESCDAYVASLPEEPRHD